MTDTTSHIEPQPMERPDMRVMFNSIAPRYDFLNHLLSLGIDRTWRRRVVNLVKRRNPATIVDIATGTADLAIALANTIKDATITGVDVAEGMLAEGVRKVHKRGLSSRISLTQGAAEDLPLPNQSFEVATIAFGIRNFNSPVAGLKQIKRVLKQGGEVYILEFTTPKNPAIKALFGFYFHRVLPWVGRMVSGHRSAYTYLPTSVEEFADREQLLAILTEAGFGSVSYQSLPFGIAAIYHGVKCESTIL